MSLEAQKSVVPDRIHLAVLREVAHVTEIPHYHFLKTKRLGEVPYDWKKANITHNFEKEGGSRLLQISLSPKSMKG